VAKDKRREVSSNRARRRTAELAAARRRRYGWIGAVVGVAVIVAAVLVAHATTSSPASAASKATAPAVGRVAPNARFTTLAGKTETVADLRGHPVLVWLMTTWCSSCQASTETMAQYLPELRAAGVRVLQVENYDDLGQSGPALGQFARVLAGSAFKSSDWTFGTASAQMTRAYNPGSELDIYYLLNARGQVTYINSTPSATMPQLLSAAGRLS